MATGGGISTNLEGQFTNFSKFGDSRSDGHTITLSNADKWMKQAKIIDGKKITTTDTGIAFNKFKTKTMDLSTFSKYVAELAQQKKIDPKELIQKLVECGSPGTTATTQAVHVGGVDRLTDTSKYTGTHRERFDSTGKGKGIAGREDIADDRGYVTGYKNADTYDKTH